MLLFSLLLTACLDTFPTGKETTYVDNPTDDFDGDGQTEEEGDCADNNASVYLGSAEFDPDVCGPDDDGDGYAPLEVGGSDCNDELSTVYPGAAVNEADICASDEDGDGYAPLEYGGTDCDDTEALARPGGTEVCGDNLDNDCNGAVDDQPVDIQEWYEDADGDGFGTENSKVLACELSKPDGYVEAKIRENEIAFDCDDTRADVSPDSPEVCDDVDNNCDGVI